MSSVSSCSVRDKSAFTPGLPLRSVEVRDTFIASVPVICRRRFVHRQVPRASIAPGPGMPSQPVVFPCAAMSAQNPVVHAVRSLLDLLPQRNPERQTHTEGGKSSQLPLIVPKQPNNQRDNHQQKESAHLVPPPQLNHPSQMDPAAIPPRAPSSFVAEAVRKVGPAVVRIDTETTVSTPSGIPPGLESLFEDPGFKKYFTDEFGGRLGPPKSRLEHGLGSGFIISKDGLIVTNAHVVKGADKLTVTLTDGRTFVGQVRGTDELLDLAVVKIDPVAPTSSAGILSGLDGDEENDVLESYTASPGENDWTRRNPLFGRHHDSAESKKQSQANQLPVAQLGSSADVNVGDWCIAIGNPHGLNNTVTLGIVSSLNRSAAEVGIPEKRLNLIQTSAPLNAGNSGGAIANEFGEVIGVAMAVRANAEGIGFAIPIDRVKDIVSELASGKTIAHPFVGIKMVTLTPDFARQNNSNPNAPVIIPEIDGAIVLHVIPESPAAQPLGLRRFDIIVGIDGTKCRGVKDVQAIVEKAAVGQRLNVQVIRGGNKNKPMDVSIVTGDLAKAKVQEAPVIIPMPSPYLDPRT